MYMEFFKTVRGMGATRVRLSVWESCYRTWKKNPAEAFNQFKVLLDAWNETSTYLRSFSLASGITSGSTEVAMGVKMDGEHTTVIADGNRYYLSPRRYAVVRALAAGALFVEGMEQK